jgi:response regulator RpfG family c-di-GMP phosphodiesterase
VLKASEGTGERMTDRRSRPTKGTVVVIDGDSRSCDRVARALEVHGYHVLTAETPSEGAKLARARRPDAVVAIDGQPEDYETALRDIVLPAHTLLVLRCRESTPDRDRDVDAAGHAHVVRVHQRLGADQLGWLLDRVVRTHGD